MTNLTKFKLAGLALIMALIGYQAYMDRNKPYDPNIACKSLGKDIIALSKEKGFENGWYITTLGKEEDKADLKPSRNALAGKITISCTGIAHDQKGNQHPIAYFKSIENILKGESYIAFEELRDPTDFLVELSGVWKVKGGLLTFYYPKPNPDKAVYLLIKIAGNSFIQDEEVLIPVTLGSIDEVNGTANFNYPLEDGTIATVTLHREYTDKNKDRFRLHFISNDGDDEELSFIRIPSDVDIKHLVDISNKNKSAAKQAAAVSPQNGAGHN